MRLQWPQLWGAPLAIEGHSLLAAPAVCTLDKIPVTVVSSSLVHVPGAPVGVETERIQASVQAAQC